MILILDNHDSFTFNLYHQVMGLGKQVVILQSDATDLEGIEKLKPEALILSAGPKTPMEAGITLEAIRHFQDTLPILGVCLGHQSLGMAAGAQVREARELIHGRAVPIRFESDSRLFAEVLAPFTAARYNSLVLDQAPQGYRITATDLNGDIMAMEHESLPLFGVQFHPESFMTKQGNRIVRNFLYGN